MAEEEKKTLSAKEVVTDIRAGATDEFLMRKYGLSDNGLQSLFQKLVTAKLLTQDDLDCRTSGVEVLETTIVEHREARPVPSPSTQTGFTCPVCGAPWERKFDKCLECGFSNDILADVKADMSFENISEKHMLSERRLKDIFQRLVDAEQVREADLPLPGQFCPFCYRKVPRGTKAHPACEERNLKYQRYRQRQQRPNRISSFFKNTPSQQKFSKRVEALESEPSTVWVGAGEEECMVIYEQLKKIVLLGPRETRDLPYSDILGCHLDVRKTSSQETTGRASPVGRGLVGFLIGGPVGAALGGMSALGKRQEVKSVEEIERIDLIVTHRDVSCPAFRFKCYQRPRSNFDAEVASQALQNALGLCDWINGLKQ